MKEKYARFYQWLSAALIGTYFLIIGLHYFPADDILSRITQAQSGAIASRFIFYFCVGVLLYCFVKILFLRKSVSAFVLMIDSMLFMFIAANIFLSVITHSKSSEGCYIVSRNIVTPDTISGYRYVPGEHRQVYLFRKQKIFDTRFHANNLGYTSHTDYVKQKTKKGKRWLVLGDSFTSSNFNESNWVDMLNEKDSVTEDEFYSFSMEGIGALTWRNIFFKQIQGQYDFDGIFLAIYHEDIFRSNAVLYERDNGVNCTYTDTLSKDLGSSKWKKNNAGEQIALTGTESQIDSLIQDVSAFDWGFSLVYPALIEEYILTGAAMSLSKKRTPISVNTKPKNSERAITVLKNSTEGMRGLNSLAEIVSACKASGKQIIICSIPDSHVYDTKFSSNGVNEESVVKAIADYYHTEYFSGYRCFDFVKPEQTNQFFHADGHWNMRGSEVFADSLQSFLKSKK